MALVGLKDRERQRNADLFHTSMLSLVESCVHRGGESNSQPWCIRKNLYLTDLPIVSEGFLGVPCRRHSLRPTGARTVPKKGACVPP